MATSSAPQPDMVDWEHHTFCSYSICRASLPAVEGLHDVPCHFTHLPLPPSPTLQKTPISPQWSEKGEKAQGQLGEKEGKIPEQPEETVEEMELLTPIGSEEDPIDVQSP